MTTTARSTWDESITHDDDRAAYAYAEVTSPAERKAQMVVGSDDTLTVWVNGTQVYDFADRRGFSPDQDRFDVTLRAGTNRILVRCGNRGGPWQFSVAVTDAGRLCVLESPGGDGFDPETFRAAALKGQGSASRGRQLFSDLKGLACVKCHAVGKEGGIGRAGAVDRGGQVSSRRADRVGLLSVRQDLFGLRADDVRPGRRPPGHRHRHATRPMARSRFKIPRPS